MPSHHIIDLGLLLCGSAGSVIGGCTSVMRAGQAPFTKIA
jgi:hypothetical protein